MKYIRFQMGCLFGFIVSFLGAAVFNIAGGVPFLPVQTLWINFTTMLFQAVGLGYGQPAAGLMDPPPPRPPTADPSASTDDLARRARPHHGRRDPRRHHLRDEGRTVFSLDALSDKTFIRSTALSLITLVLTTLLGPLQAFLLTVPLDTGQWLVGIGAALPVLLASEVRVLVSRRKVAAGQP